MEITCGGSSIVANDYGRCSRVTFVCGDMQERGRPPFTAPVYSQLLLRRCGSLPGENANCTEPLVSGVLCNIDADAR